MFAVIPNICIFFRLKSFCTVIVLKSTQRRHTVQKCPDTDRRHIFLLKIFAVDPTLHLVCRIVVGSSRVSRLSMVMVRVSVRVRF